MATYCLVAVRNRIHDFQINNSWRSIPLRTNSTIKEEFFWSKCLEDDPMPFTFPSISVFEHWLNIESSFNKALMWTLSPQLAFNLKMLYGIPRARRRHKYRCCLFQLLSCFPLELMETGQMIRLLETTPVYIAFAKKKKLLTYILLVNGVILGLRLILYRKYGKDAFVFNAKNGIIIILSLFEICSTF